MVNYAGTSFLAPRLAALNAGVTSIWEAGDRAQQCWIQSVN